MRLRELFAYVPAAGEAVDAVAAWVQARLTAFGRSGYVAVGESDRREVPPTVALQALALELLARLWLPPTPPVEVLDTRSALEHLDEGRIDDALTMLEHLRATVHLVEGERIPFEDLRRVMAPGTPVVELATAWRRVSSTATGEQLLRWYRLEPWLRGLGIPLGYQPTISGRWPYEEG